ncbi:MAG TPA: hypothetical protein VM100_01055 [Longimicrobiales bacterium]|nr:hypothetical protein [Longimicrobiales bacterium]
MRALILVLAFSAVSTTTLSAQSRAQYFAHEFSKKKDHTKTRHGVTMHKFHEVVSTPWIASIDAYVGHYVGDEFEMDIRKAANGTLTVSGSDPDGAFRLRNARIADGILTGDRAYASGGTKALEAAFLNRSDRGNPRDPFTTLKGIGLLSNIHTSEGIMGPVRIFLALK